MRFLLLFTLLIIVQLGFSQSRIDKFDFHELRLLNDSVAYTNYIQYHQTSVSQSNFLTNQFEKEAFGGNITDPTKDYVSSNLKTKNLQLVLNDLRVDYQHYSKKKDAYLTIGLRMYDFTSATLSQDLVSLVLNGNAPYEGKKMNLGKSIIERYRYQSLVIGYDKQIKKDLYLGGRINLIKGVFYQKTEVIDGILFTHPNATKIDLEIDYSSIESKKDGSELARLEGLGATINLYSKYDFNVKHTVAIELDNIGFISWRDQNKYSTDSLISYEGIDLIDNDGKTIQGGSDVNEILGLQASSVDVLYVTPFSTHFVYQYRSFQHFMFSAGLKYYAFIDNLPQIYIRPGYRFIKEKDAQLSSSIIIAAGGFSRVDIGINMRLLYKQVFLSGDSFHLERLIAPRTTYSSGFSLTGGVIF